MYTSLSRGVQIRVKNEVCKKERYIYFATAPSYTTVYGVVRVTKSGPVDVMRQNLLIWEICVKTTKIVNIVKILGSFFLINSLRLEGIKTSH